jgi:hypothetical protein
LVLPTVTRTVEVWTPLAMLIRCCACEATGASSTMAVAASTALNQPHRNSALTLMTLSECREARPNVVLLLVLAISASPPLLVIPKTL